MKKIFLLTQPASVYLKHGDVEREIAIESLAAGPLPCPPDRMELEARKSLVRRATGVDGRPVSEEDLDGLDVSGALSDAFRTALARARGITPPADEAVGDDA